MNRNCERYVQPKERRRALSSFFTAVAFPNQFYALTPPKHIYFEPHWCFIESWCVIAVWMLFSRKLHVTMFGFACLLDNVERRISWKAFYLFKCDNTYLNRFYIENMSYCDQKVRSKCRFYHKRGPPNGSKGPVLLSLAAAKETFFLYCIRIICCWCVVYDINEGVSRVEWNCGRWKRLYCLLQCLLSPSFCAGDV